MAQSNLITFTNGRTLNLDRIVSTEWHQPRARRGKPAPARELLITTDILFADENGQTGPWLIFVADDDGGASELLKIIQAYARPLPAVAVEVAPFTIEDRPGEVAELGLTFRAEAEGAAAEVVCLDEPGAQPEVMVDWGRVLTPAQFLATARAIEAITADPRFLACVQRAAAPSFASAAD